MVEVEQSVVGCMLLDWESCREPPVEAEWFENPLYRDMVVGMHRLDGEGIRPDTVTLLNHLEPEAQREMLRCAERVPSLSGFPNYVKALKMEWRKRCILEKALGIQLEGNDADDMTEGFRALVAEQDEITAADRREVGRSLREAYTDFYTDLYSEDVRYLSGYSELDRFMGGLLPGTVFVLAARSGQGKTDFAVSLMMRYAAAGLKVLYYSMEMTRRQMMTRVAAQVTGINNTRIRDKSLSDFEKSTISRAFNAIQGKDTIRIAEERPNLAAIRENIQAFQPAVIFIDHLSLMKMPRRKNRNEEVAETTRAIKALALETGVAVVELVQMNREVEKRSSKRPLLSDLKESGSIEEDADYILFLQARKRTEPLKKDEAFEAFGFLEKNRHGGTGIVRFAWRPQYSRFTQVTMEGGYDGENTK